MTLKETHELQRRELISLRAKIARLEKQTTGLFPVEEPLFMIMINPTILMVHHIRNICDALTIIETAKMQNRNVYDTVEAAFTK